MTYSQLFQFLKKFVAKQKWTFFFIYLFDSIAWPLEALVWPWILSRFVFFFTMFETDRSGAWQTLQPFIFFGIGAYLLIETLSRLQGFLMGKALPKIQADIRMCMFEHVERHSPRYFNERFAGSLANKIFDMTTQVEQIAQQLFWPILPALVVCIAATVIFWSIQPLFAYCLGAWIIIHLSVVFLFSRKIDVYGTEHEEVKSTLSGKIVDSLTNNFAVNLFHRFKYERNLLEPHQEQEQKTNQKSRIYQEKMLCFFSSFFLLNNVLLINGSLIYLWLQAQISTAHVVQIFSSMWGVTTSVLMAGNALPHLFASLGAAKQAGSLMLDPEDVNDAPGAKPLHIRTGEIVFKNVSFGYSDKELFTNKQVHIRGGEKVGIVGFTGAGKSTFTNLILRFFPIHKGSILIDGQDINQVTLSSLRQNIALIPQDPVLFHRSLRENIAYGKIGATEEEIIESAKLAHSDEFIRNIPGGYDAKVGERGTKLSGGEKQRIAIARALLANTPILILDEATSSLDSVTERYIQESLNTLMQNKTTIIIAHRLSTLLRMDRILVFEQGRIVEEGPHEELLQKKGLYSRMWNMQVGGFLPNTEGVPPLKPR